MLLQMVIPVVIPSGIPIGCHFLDSGEGFRGDGSNFAIWVLLPETVEVIALFLEFASLQLRQIPDRVNIIKAASIHMELKLPRERETPAYTLKVSHSGEETQIEVKNEKSKEVVKNIFPGYLFVEMIMTDEAWYVVRNTPGVTGFIGSSGGGAKPFPVKQDEIEKILRRIGQSDKSIEVDFAVGDSVKILSGPFSGMEGKVESMNDQTQVATVLIILFGRETPTDINYVDLAKAEF